MSTPGEHKTVQARILAYAQEIGGTMCSEKRRGFPSFAFLTMTFPQGEKE